MRLSYENREHVQRVMSSYFQTFFDVYYKKLETTEENFYKVLDRKLRDKLLANHGSVSKMKTVCFLCDTCIFNVITSGVSSYLLFSNLSDNIKTKVFQIIGGITLLIYTIYKLFQSIQTYMIAVHLPIYNEQQIRLSSLLLTYLFSFRTAITADSVGQQFLNYLEDKYNENKTLSQNALEAFNGEHIK
ncbi:MAG: hypothetical protein FADNKDHG_01438 [Holosporales bacterium]